jgi:hypothetical protein
VKDRPCALTAPNKLTPKMLSVYLDCAEDYVKFLIDHGKIKAETWYGERLIDESEARRIKYGLKGD